MNDTIYDFQLQKTNNCLHVLCLLGGEVTVNLQISTNYKEGSMRWLIILITVTQVGCVSFQEKTFKIRDGAKEEDVVELLGEPVQRTRKGTRVLYTYYPDHSGFEYPYYVVFEEGRVIRWSADPHREAAAREAAREKSRRLKAFGDAMSQASRDFQNTRRPSGQECGPLSIAPIATPGCKYQCINGNWAEVCSNGF